MHSHKQHTLCVHCGSFLNTAAELLPRQWNNLSMGTSQTLARPPVAVHPGKGKWPTQACNTINTLCCLRFCTLQNALLIYEFIYPLLPKMLGVDHVGFTSWLSISFWREEQGEGCPNMIHTEWLNELNDTLIKDFIFILINLL